MAMNNGKMVIAADGNLYVSQPAPRNNPEGRLDGEWIIRRVKPGQHINQGEIVIRFDNDGRDRAESHLLNCIEPAAQEAK